MYLKFLVYDPRGWPEPNFREIRMNVNDSVTVGRIKSEMLPKLTRTPAPISNAASLTKGLSREVICARGSIDRLIFPEDQPQEAVRAFVSLVREAKLDDSLSLRDQGVIEESYIFLCIDIDFAIRCSRCQKPLNLGYLLHEFGRVEAGAYVFLEARCPKCGFRRTIVSMPPAIVELRDATAEPMSAQNPRKIEASFLASDWVRAQSEQQMEARLAARLREEERQRGLRREKERCPVDSLRCPLGYYWTPEERKKCPIHKCPSAN